MEKAHPISGEGRSCQSAPSQRGVGKEGFKFTGDGDWLVILNKSFYRGTRKEGHNLKAWKEKYL